MADLSKLDDLLLVAKSNAEIYETRISKEDVRAAIRRIRTYISEEPNQWFSFHSTLCLYLVKTGSYPPDLRHAVRMIYQDLNMSTDNIAKIGQGMSVYSTAMVTIQSQIERDVHCERQ